MRAAAVVGVYVVALIASLVAGFALVSAGVDVVWAVLAADVVGTLVVFAGSVWKNNSSMYDAYWSVAPMVVVLAVLPGLTVRNLLVIALVWAWGGRLTWNWFRRWEGMDDEDWRYIDLREQSGSLYWLVSFGGIHFFPTLLVFGGLLPFLTTFGSDLPLNALDVAGALLTALAIWLEATADQQLRAFVHGDRKPEDILQTGLWGISRHPNYLGETLLWWGLLLLGLGGGAPWWAAIGAVAITALFVFISIPLIETRMLAKRPHYAEVQQRIPALFPFLRL